MYASVFITELFGKAIGYAENSNCDNFVILSYSQLVLQVMKYFKTTLYDLLGNIINILLASAKSYSLMWVPGHCRILGKEKADILAYCPVELEMWEFP